MGKEFTFSAGNVGLIPGLGSVLHPSSVGNSQKSMPVMESHVRHRWPGFSPLAGLSYLLWAAWGECGLNSGVVAGDAEGPVS